MNKAEIDALTEQLDKPQLQELVCEAYIMLSYSGRQRLETKIKMKIVENRPKEYTGATVKKRMEETPPGVDPKEHAFQVAEEHARSFLKYAWNGVYMQDAGFDNVISREDYLRWDVQVRAVLQAIDAIGPESPSFQRAVELQMELYELFCFSNEFRLLRKKQTFHTLKTRQDTYLQQLIDRIRQAYPREEAIPRMVQATAYLGPDLRDTDIFYLGRLLLRNLQPEEDRRLALAEARRLIEVSKTNPRSYRSAVKLEMDDLWFQGRYQSNLMVLTGMLEASFSREDLERQVREALADRETPEYHLHQFLAHTQSEGVWKQVYEIGMSMGLPLDEGDQERYRQLTEKA